jgi:hypothetical protein
MFWSIILQVLSVALFAFVRLLRGTFDPGKGKLKTLGWIFMGVGAVSLLTSLWMNASRHRDDEERLQEQLKEIRTLNEKTGQLMETTQRQQNKLYDVLSSIVMKTPKGVGASVLRQTTSDIRIAFPLDKSEQPSRSYVEGNISDPLTTVWVVVHPIETGAFWVQPIAGVKKNGDWKTLMYLGRTGNIDVGKRFEIMAVAKPKVALNEAEVLNEWPEAQWRSQMIEVIRK